VLVHDAVRPLIDAATIERTIDAVAEYGAAIVGMPAVTPSSRWSAPRTER
jgi:2-C-methyl-D-erythritol 4-phosphate cytidylyltransferase